MRKTILITLALGCFTLTGCQTTNPYTGESQTSKAAVYSGVGALSGAVLGALANGKNGALAGAIAGGALGAGAGYYQGNYSAPQQGGTAIVLDSHGDKIEYTPTLFFYR